MLGNNFVTTGMAPRIDVSMGSAVWTLVSLILAAVGCFLVYFLFVKKEVKTDSKFLKWLKSFLNFDTMLIESILKIAYIFVVIFITLSSFSLISYSFLSFVVTLIFGNLIARIIYELILITVMIWKNTAEIKKSLKK
ncbi:MAG: hypothetical protein IJK66_02765 [Bacilli bacterium]|nr:hypothetical protein [Bacillota bacterium]MBQ6282443.1 hypothetical protein [Bacilli bacterium]